MTFVCIRGMKRKVQRRMAQIYGIDDLKSKHLCDSPQTHHKEAFLSSIIGFKKLVIYGNRESFLSKSKRDVNIRINVNCIVVQFNSLPFKITA